MPPVNVFEIRLSLSVVCLFCCTMLVSAAPATAQSDEEPQPSVDLAEPLKVAAAGDDEQDEKQQDDLEAEVRLTALQPPAEQPAVAPPRRTRSPRTRLARAPSMFGDFFAPPAQFAFSRAGDGLKESVSGVLPLGGAFQRSKVSDNGKAVPTDRIFFMYNHYHNAVQGLGSSSGPPPPPISVDRYVVGFEKTFFNEDCSFEFRVPFATPADFSMPPPTDPAVFIPGDEIGNINLVFKSLVYQKDNLECAIGLGIDLPTSGDARATVDPLPLGPPGQFSFLVKNEAVYLQPFAAFLATPGQDTFVHGFVQFDVPTSGNLVTIADPAKPSPVSLGSLNDSALFQVDLAFGRWLYKNPSAGSIRGIAGVVELHYITTIQDADTVSGSVPGGSELTLGNAFNRQDFLDLTAGLHVQLFENTALRVAGVAPLRRRPDRTFDGELMLQVNHFFR